METVCLADIEKEIYIHAASIGDIERMKAFLEKDYSFLECEDFIYKSTALSWACEYEQIEVVKYLLKLNANIHHIDLLGYTPIMYAARNENSELITLLEQVGAKLHILESHIDFKSMVPSSNTQSIKKHSETIEKNPLWLAVRYKNYKQAKFLLRNDPFQEISIEILKQAIENQDFSMCKFFLQTTPFDCDTIRSGLDDIIVSLSRQRCQELSNYSNGNLYNMSEFFLNFLQRHFPQKPPLAMKSFDTILLDKAYKTLFEHDGLCILNESAPSKDKAIRIAIAHAFQILNSPNNCIPYLEMLNKALLDEWKILSGQQSVRSLHSDQIDFFMHSWERMLWPMPTKSYRKCIPTLNVIEKTLVKAFQGAGIGFSKYKYFGYIPTEIANEHFLDLIIDDSSSISGLLHGDMSHNIQRYILLKAVQAGAIPCNYIENNEIKKISIIEFFESLVKQKSKDNDFLWVSLLDVANYSRITFSHPHRLHSVLLTDPLWKNTGLQIILQRDFLRKYKIANHLWNNQHSMHLDSKQFSREIVKESTHFFKTNLFLVNCFFSKHLKQGANVLKDIKDNTINWFVTQSMYNNHQKRSFSTTSLIKFESDKFNLQSANKDPSQAIADNYIPKNHFLLSYNKYRNNLSYYSRKSISISLRFLKR